MGYAVVINFSEFAAVANDDGRSERFPELRCLYIACLSKWEVYSEYCTGCLRVRTELTAYETSAVVREPGSFARTNI